LSFDALGLREELLRALATENYTVATPIQAQAIPEVLKGRDVLAAAQTGTGKTAAFTLPVLQRLMTGRAQGGRRPVRCLIVTPTRELAAQIATDASTLAEDGREVALELRRLVTGDLRGMFDGPTTAGLALDAPLVVLDLSAVYGSAALGILMACATAWVQAALDRVQDAYERFRAGNKFGKIVVCV